MTTVAKIIYTSRQLATAVSPGAEQLFLYDSQGNLLWLGTRWNNSNKWAITPSEWETGTWETTFEKGGIPQDASGNLVYSDTATTSVTATINKDLSGSAAKIVFTYGGRTYVSYLTNYNQGTNMCAPQGNYVTWVPNMNASSAELPTYAANSRNAIAPSDTWDYATPTCSPVLASPGTKVNVGWTALDPTGGTGEILSASRVLEYGTDPNFASPTVVTLTGTSGTETVTGLNKDTIYYFRVRSDFTTSNEESSKVGGGSATASLRTIRQLTPPSSTLTAGWTDATHWNASSSWSAVQPDDKVAGYEYAIGNSSDPTGLVGTSLGSATSWSSTDPSLRGKFLFLRTTAMNDQFEYETSGWALAGNSGLIPNVDWEGEDTPEPIVIIPNRAWFAAIPYIDVPKEQIGKTPKDAITFEFAEDVYMHKDGSVPASQLPIASASALGAIKVGTHLSINANTGVLSVSANGSIASGNTGLVTGGTVYAETNKYAAFANKSIATSVASGNSNPVTSGAVYTFVTTRSNLPKAKAAGGATNAGVVYVNATAGNDGLVIDSSNDGLIKVNFATYSAWDSTTATTVANPSYVKQAIEGYVADATKVTATGGSSTYAGRIVKLNGDGVIDGSMLKVVSVTNFYEAASQAAMTSLSSAQDGDICIRTDEHKTYILMSDKAANGYATASNWKELTAPTGTVTSVNGKVGPTVTLLATDIYAKSGTKISALTALPNGDTYALWTGSYISSKIGEAVGVNLRITSAQISDLLTSESEDMNSFGENGLVVDDSAVAAYVTSVVGELGTASSANVSTQGVKDGETGLVTGDQVYDYQPLLTRSKWTANQAVAGVYTGTATAPSSENYYIASAYAVKKWIDSAKYTLTKASKTALGGVYFPELDEAHRINGLSYDPSTGALGMFVANGTQIGTVFTNANSGISIANGAVSIAAATADYLGGVKVGTGNGLTFSSNKLAVSLANGTSPGTVKQGTNTGVTIASGVISVTFSTSISTDAASDVKAATPKAVKTYVDGASYAISAFTSGASGQGKVVKTQSSGSNAGYISADLIPIDEYSIVLNGGCLEVPVSYLDDYVSMRGLVAAGTVETTYLKQGVVDTPLWSFAPMYNVGDQVQYKGLLYEATAQNSASDPAVYSGTGVPAAQRCWKKITLSDILGGYGRYETTLTRTSSATEYDIIHGLGTMYVQVQMFDSNNNEVFAAIQAVSDSTVRIGFGAALESGATKTYKVVVRK